jgi:ATP-dependent Lon protease
MPRDNQHKMSKKETNKSKKREEDAKKKKNSESSDDDSSLYTDEDEDEMDVHEYRKFLKNIFPSKHLDKKIKAGERLKKKATEDSEEEFEDELEEDKLTKNKSNKIVNKSISTRLRKDDEEKKSPKKKSGKVVKKQKKQLIVSDEEDLSSTDSIDNSEEEDEEEDDEEERPKGGKFNIIFTIGGKHERNEEYESDEDEDEDWETDSNSDIDTENEDDPISSDSDEDDEKEEEEEKIHIKKKCNKHMCKKENNDIKESDKNEENKSKNIDDSKSILNQLKDLLSKNPNDKSIEKCIDVYESDIKNQKLKKEKTVKKEKARNGRIFKRIIRDKNTMNDFEFYDKLETEQQKKIIKELREINKITRIEKPYRLTLLECDIPVTFKSTAMKKISSLRYMDPGSGEYYKIKNWVDTFMRIPFNKIETLPISIEDGVDKCHDFMANAQKTLDDAVYGLNDAKMQIMQMLGQLITNPKSIGSAIAIHGPPGTGKTSLVKDGISKILNRPFAFIALGGATDSSFLEGHGYTYEGSTWGKIVQILIDTKCMNPIIYFDELDKISDTPKGEEITGILTHLTDTTQNTQFHDKYFAELDFDLSKCTFIFSYNDESKVNPILKDRMYRIQTKGYNQKQKTVIANIYLLPKIREQVKFKSEDIIIPEQTIHYIIENHCNKEDGVRNLKRCLEIVYTKLNLYRLMRPDSNLFEEDMSLKVEFPFTVTKTIIDKLIKTTDSGVNSSLYMLYI